MKNGTENVHSVEQVPTLLVNDKKLKDPKKGNAFSYSFITSTKK
jgi:hypothetical protein